MGEIADQMIEDLLDRYCGPVYPRRRGRARSPAVIPSNDPLVRAMRQKAHRSFDRIWRQGLMSRSEAYEWLADQLGIPACDAHMGRMMDCEILQRVIDLSDNYIGTTEAQEDFPDDL